MAIVKFGTVLTQAELEKHLATHHLYRDGERGWIPNTGSVLELDLSRVEDVDFVALAQIALLVEGAARHGVPVQVATPLRRLSTAERNRIECPPDTGLDRHQAADFVTRVTRRRQSYAFMSRCGFIDALKPKHVPGIDRLVRLRFDFDDFELTEARPIAHGDLRVAGDGGTNDQAAMTSAREVVPLRWLDYDGSGLEKAWEGEIATALALRAPVLTTHDVDAIVTIVLRELVDNVGSHASTYTPGARHRPVALLGAIAIAGGEDRTSSPVGDRTMLGRYTSWLNERQATVIRLVVGDSGRGICSALEPPPMSARYVDLPNLGRQLEQSERSLLWALSPRSSRGYHARAGGQLLTITQFPTCVGAAIR